MNKYKDLAKRILDINCYDVNYIPQKLNLNDSNILSKAFYKDFFSGFNIYDIDDKLYFYKDSNLKDYDGACKIKKIVDGKIDFMQILTPKEETIKNIVTLTHEKAHCYHFFNNKTSNEIAPSFLDIMQAITLNKTNSGIKEDNINYKIKQAQIAAKIYLKKSKIFYKDEELENQINYMTDFLKTNILLEEYYNDPIYIKKLIYNDIFTSDNTSFNNIYVDKNTINKVEFIKKI